uniref:Uncharacterized protein n=2 Tax=Babesia bovis TaxID=5865 RepID=A7AU77_BABBO|eukprot:XP_001610056.1 hypothetical protein [Babesia bovis T2Bo]
MKLPMCKSRRRVKDSASGGTHPAGEIVVDESETEITTDEMAQETPGYVSVELKNNESNKVPNEPVEERYEAKDELSIVVSDERAPEIEAEIQEPLETNRTTVESLPPEDDDVLALYLRDAEVAAIEDRRSFSQDFTALQDYCRNRIEQLMSDQDVALKCAREMVPSIVQNCLAVPTECQTCQPIVRGCLGLGDCTEGQVIDNTEFRVVEDRGHNDMPTLPTGMWFVDTINEAFDKWSEYDSNVVNLFRLLNFSALLSYCGDASGDRIVALLTRTSSIVSRGPEAWREIIRSFTVEETVVAKPMPVVPNAKFVSRCETRLDDVPNLDVVTTNEDPFRVYWFYTEKWIRSRLNPSAAISQELATQSRMWFNSLESTAQELFTRLSRTLCCQRVQAIE